MLLIPVIVDLASVNVDLASVIVDLASVNEDRSVFDRGRNEISIDSFNFLFSWGI